MTDSKHTSVQASPLATVVYDRQCPACHSYCLLLVKARPEDSVQLMDARSDTALMNEITRRGLDIDEGMVVELEDELYYGADAISVLARQHAPRGVFNFLNRIFFSNPRAAQVLYPALKGVRNLLLKLLRVKKINNLGRSGNERF